MTRWLGRVVTSGNSSRTNVIRWWIYLEPAFTQLLWRWGVFLRALRMPFGKRTLVIQVAFMLHNLCRANDASPLKDFGRGDSAYEATCAGIVCPWQAPRRRRGAGSNLRRRMPAAVRNSGRVHPPVHGE